MIYDIGAAKIYPGYARKDRSGSVPDSSTVSFGA